MGNRSKKRESHHTDHKQTVRFTDNSDLPNIIELRNICQTYDGENYIIDGLNLLIENKPGQGQFVVILGKSGCGKSTVLRYICGLQKPTSGDVLLHDKPIDKTDHISMVFQQYLLATYPWYTVVKNVMLPLEYRGVDHKTAKDKALSVLEQVGLVDQANKFAQYPILSGGQLQRVAIARSLITNPELILMDEPFGALDIHTRFKMQILIDDLWERIQSTIIFVTHDIQEAVFLGDDIWVMGRNPGQIIKTFHVDLPLHRNRDTRKNPRFTELVHEIEDFMFDLA